MDPAESLDQPPQAWLVGGGIASLAAAALLIRDGGMPGRHIHVLEQSDVLGGSLDGAGSSEAGYVIRGGRMFEEHFVCTYDLFGSIPALDDPGKTVTRQIQEFTRQVITSSRSRLVCDGRKIEAPAFGLSLKDKCNLACLAVASAKTGCPSFFFCNLPSAICGLFYRLVFVKLDLVELQRGIVMHVELGTSALRTHWRVYVKVKLMRTIPARSSPWNMHHRQGHTLTESVFCRDLESELHNLVVDRVQLAAGNPGNQRLCV